MPVLLLRAIVLPFCTPLHGADHVKGLLRQIVMLAVNNLAETLIVSSASRIPFQAGKLSLRRNCSEEPLTCARARRLACLRQTIRRYRESRLCL